MNPFNSATPIGFLMLVLDSRLRKQGRDERGVSAVEWVIISAIVVGICIAVAAILMDALTSEATDIGNKIKNQ